MEKGDIKKARKKAQQTSTITPEAVVHSKILLDALGVPYIEAPGEGEAQASFMNEKGDVDYCNPEMANISGINKGTFIKRVKPFALPTYKKIGLINKIKEVFKGKSFSLEPIEYKSHYGKKKTIRKFVGIPIKERGKVKKAMIAVVDFTKVKGYPKSFP